MKLYFLSILLLLTSPTFGFTGLEYLKIDDAGRVVFIKEYKSNLSYHELKDKLMKVQFVSNVIDYDTVLAGKIYKAEIPIKEFRSEEYGASEAIRSPFNGQVNIEKTDQGYKVIVFDVVFDRWNNTRAGRRSGKISIVLSELAAPKGRLLESGHKYQDAAAFMNFVDSHFSFN